MSNDALQDTQTPSAARDRLLSPLTRNARRILLGVSAAALLAGGIAFGVDARSPDPLFSAQSSASARAVSGQSAVPGFSDLAAAVKPAVVSVRVKARGDQSEVVGFGAESPFEGTPFEKFFKDFQSRNGHGRNVPQQARPIIQGQGSGFFVSADGYIVTNNHVVNNAVEVEVVTDAGATYKARVIGTDAKTDLALIKVEGKQDFPFVRLASDKARIGEWVVAMGNPFGLGGTVTAGIVSAEGRDIGSGPYDDFIQIDAPVNRGNSGGPTFNLKGEVIGVNTAIYSPSGGSVGIAFAIPASTVRSIIPQLQQNGHVSRGWLGVSIQPVTKGIADALSLDTAEGALVSEPQPGTPASKAGLKSGDVIVTLDGTPVKDAREFARRIASSGAGKTINLGIVRDGKHSNLSVTLAQMKEKHTQKLASNANGEDQSFKKLGIAVAPSDEVQGAGDDGLAIVDVSPDGAAAEAGLEPGDVILKAGSKSIASANDLENALQKAKEAGRSRALLLVRRKTAERYVAVPVATG
ncbi:MAG: Do family serine endopeptidase [Hyphomicrobiaceae bacterium]